MSASVSPLVRAAERTIRDFRLLAPGDRVLIAVSGGPDSVCLALILGALAADWRLKLYLFHLNHLLRGRQAVREERLVAALARKLDLPCVVERADVRAHAREQKLSLEQAGRERRYQLMEQAAERLGCSKIAVGHNANDNAETILINLVRGGGLASISGIPMRRGRIVRPLLRTRRADIERFVRETGFRTARDRSNFRLEFRRNFVRHRVMPLFETMNPDFVTTMARTSDVLQADNSLLAVLGAQVVSRIAQRHAGGWLVDFRRLAKYNLALRRRALKLLVPELTFDEVTALLDLGAGAPGRRKTLGNAMVGIRERDGLFIGRVPGRIAAARPVSVPGRTDLEEYDLTMETEILEPTVRTDWRSDERRVEFFDRGVLCLPLAVRGRRPGDRMRVFGGRTRKLQDILVDDKIPARSRDRVAVLCDRKGILWVVGSRRADRARITKQTKSVLRVGVS